MHAFRLQSHGRAAQIFFARTRRWYAESWVRPVRQLWRRLPQSRARQEAAGVVTIESSTGAHAYCSRPTAGNCFIGVKTLTQLSRRFLTGAALWVPMGT